MKNGVLQSARFWRGVLAGTGVCVLLWSGLEDTDAVAAAGLGAFASIAVTMWLLCQRADVTRGGILLASLAGALTGALASLVTAALMLFKDLLHAHPFPDFPASMILGILERLPPWTVAGALAGIGIGLLQRLRQLPRQRRPYD